jgi:hypothetical protein
MIGPNADMCIGDMSIFPSDQINWRACGLLQFIYSDVRRPKSLSDCKVKANPSPHIV